jgi:hypothetical protein
MRRDGLECPQRGAVLSILIPCGLGIRVFEKLFSCSKPFVQKGSSVLRREELKTNLANQGHARSLMVDCRFSSCVIALY